MPKRLREQNRGVECEARKPAEIFADFQEAGSYLTEKLLGELENFYHSHVRRPSFDSCPNIKTHYFSSKVLKN
jgi:hypothetical protein